MEKKILISDDEFIELEGLDADNWVVVGLPNGKAGKISRDVLKAFLGTVETIVPKAISIGDPAPVIPGIYRPTASGTYANLGGLVIDMEGKMNEVLYDGSTFANVVTPLPSGHSMVSDWEPGFYVKDTVKVVLGNIYRANKDTDLEPIISEDWDDLSGKVDLSDYLEKTDIYPDGDKGLIYDINSPEYGTGSVSSSKGRLFNPDVANPFNNSDSETWRRAHLLIPVKPGQKWRITTKNNSNTGYVGIYNFGIVSDLFPTYNMSPDSPEDLVIPDQIGFLSVQWEVNGEFPSVDNFKAELIEDPSGAIFTTFEDVENILKTSRGMVSYGSEILNSGALYPSTGQLVEGDMNYPSNPSYYKYPREWLRVHKGDSITITSSGGTSARAWLLTDLTGLVTGRASNTTASLFTETITIEHDGYFIPQWYYSSPFDLIEDDAFAVIIKKPDSETRLDRPFNILGIGNSYTKDYLSQMPFILTSAGVPRFNVTYLGAGSATWNQVALSLDSTDWPYISSYSNGGQWGNPDNIQSIKDALRLREWDFIIINQQSSTSVSSELYPEGLKDVINMIRKQLINQDTKICIADTHAYRNDVFPQEMSGITINSQLEQKELTSENVFSALTDFWEVSKVIPYGIAIQNARTALPGQYGDFSGDGIHISQPIGGFVAALAIFLETIAQTHGYSAEDVTYRPSGIQSDSDYETIKQAAVNAVKVKYEVTEI